MAKHTRQNRFAGGTPRARGKAGGVAYVGPQHTLGQYPCWCQGDICTFDDDGKQDWPGKGEGKPHPRTREEAAMATLEDQIAPNQLKGWPREVSDLIKRLVNEEGCRWRPSNAGKLLIYPPGEGDFFTVSKMREHHVTTNSLIRWALSLGLLVDDNKPEPEKKPVPKPPTVTFSGKPDGQRIPAKAVAPAPAPPKPPKPDTETVWTRHLDRDGEETRFDTDGKRFRCRLCHAEGKEWITDNAYATGGHIRMSHTDTSDLYSEETIATRVETRRANAQMKRITEHVEGLMAALDLRAGDPEQEAALQRQVAELTRRAEEAETMALEAIQRAEDAEAKVTLLTEALAPFRGALEALEE